MKEIQIHAYSRLSPKTINKIDHAEVKDPRKQTPAERYIRSCTLEGVLLSNLEKNPALLEARSMFDKRIIKAAANLEDSGVIEGESGLTHTINYDKLPDLVKKTQNGEIFELINNNRDGLTRKEISENLGYAHNSDIDNMLESGLIKKGQIKRKEKWTDIFFSYQNSEEIREEQNITEKIELSRLSDIIEKQLNKQKGEKRKQLDPISIKILEIINTTPALNIKQASKYDVGLDSPYYNTKKISELMESGSIIALNSDDLGITAIGVNQINRWGSSRRGRWPTIYLFSRGYFEKYLEEKKSLQSPEIKTKMMSDIEKRKEESKEQRKQK